MRDNNTGIFPLVITVAFMEQFFDGPAQDTEILNIDPGFRFIDQAQQRVLEQQLENFRPFHLTAGKPEINVPVHETFQFQQMGVVFDIFAVPRVPIDQFAETVELDALDAGRPLERHPDTHFRTLGYREMGNVGSPENNGPLFYRVFGKSHEGHEKRTFPNAVGAEKNNGLTVPDV